MQLREIKTLFAQHIGQSPKKNRSYSGEKEISQKRAPKPQQVYGTQLK
jgi:hypothetical protein